MGLWLDPLQFPLGGLKVWSSQAKELFGKKNPGLISSTHFPSTGWGKLGSPSTGLWPWRTRALWKVLEEPGGQQGEGEALCLPAGLLPFLAVSRPLEQNSIM